MDLFQGNNTRVLDVFAGSGSIGLEALSRGANHVTFVDMAPNCIETALKNANNCGFEYKASSACGLAEDVLNNPIKYGLKGTYDIISLTPPYEEVIYKDLLHSVCNTPLISEDSIVIVEYPEEMGTLPYILGDNQLYGVRNRKYGRTILALYVYRPSKSLDMRPDEFLGKT